jgi:2-aminoethylphosphonate-pyruvate transaminase
MSAYKGPDGQEDMPYLLTAGPVTTSRAVKLAMLADYEPHDDEFRNATRFVRNELKRIAGCDDSYDTVLLQGSGTVAIEAAIGTFCPTRRKKTLIICNGASGEHAAQMFERIGRPFLRLTYRETSMPRASDVASTLDEDKSISHVWLSHIEPSTGMLNPLVDIAHVVKARGRVMMVDATSSFGGVALNVVESCIDVLVSTSDRCLEGVPGLSFVIARRDHLEAATAQCHSLVLDLHAEWRSLEDTGQFRFTPPTQALVALREALRELETEGGIDGRSKRYKRNAETLRERVKALGLSLALEDAYASTVLQAILAPRVATFDFKRFCDSLHERGFAIAPGGLAQRQSFRIGCIGKVDEKVVQQLVVAIEDVLNAMDVRSYAPGDA